MQDEFLKSIKNRRSHYALGKNVKISDDTILEIVTESLKHSPSAFNSQSARVIVLFSKHHEKLWDITKSELEKILPAEAFLSTKNKIENAFQSGYATILYFEDMSVVSTLQQKFPAYLENFPIWSNQSSGMLQFAVWTALENYDIGASLQHYNPLIDNAVKSEWDIPDSWKLIAEMPIGSIEKPAETKEFSPIQNRIKIYK